MLPNEKRGFDLYIESATFENGFIPLSFAKIAEKLKEEQYSGSKASVHRWSKKYKWEEQLHLKRQKAILVAGGDKDIQEKAISVLDEKTKVDVERNAILIGGSYDVMEGFIEKVKAEMARGIYKLDNIKLAKDIAVLVTGREDKMLDRLADMGADRLSSQDLKAEFEAIEVDFE